MTQKQFEYIYQTALLIVENWDHHQVQFPAKGGTVEKMVRALTSVFNETVGRDRNEPFSPTYELVSTLMRQVAHVHNLSLPYFIAAHDAAEFFTVDAIGVLN